MAEVHLSSGSQPFGMSWSFETNESWELPGK
jgi:hypothetical protein